MVVIPTDRTLVLRQIEPDDAEELFAVTNRNRDHLREWLPWIDHTRVVAATAAFINHTRHVAGLGTGLHCVILEHGQIVGTVSYNRIEAVHRRACIGYWLAREACGRGVMTRAVSAFVHYGFSRLALNRQVIACATGNRASAAIAERCGFRFEGVLREAELIRDRFVDHRIHSRLRSEHLAALAMAGRQARPALDEGLEERVSLSAAA